ncbi:reverse transcriptase domain-containing protein [Tanacetum coccineum]|uniref:Reverse transcriptase domain-containing protein n=1 Tax=Tanacetum coccineum TaxID=301880 RepID=A0ABQ5E9G7_9ASTR
MGLGMHGVPGMRSERACAAAARPAGGFRADYGFVATMDRQIRRDPERYVGYGITDSKFLCGSTRELDDEHRDRTLIETEVGMSREAWGQAMDASDLAHGGVISLRTTMHAQMAEIAKLQSADRRRQRAMSDLLETDRRRREEMREDDSTPGTSHHTAGAGDSLTGTGDDIEGGYCIDRGQQDPMGSCTARLYQRITENGTKKSHEINPSPTNSKMKTTQNGYEAQLQALIDQGVVAAMAEAEASRHSNAQQLAKVKSRDLHSAEDALTCNEENVNDKYCPRVRSRRLRTECGFRSRARYGGPIVDDSATSFDCVPTLFSRRDRQVEKYIGGLPDRILGSVKAIKSEGTMQEVIVFTTELLEDKTHAYAERQAERGKERMMIFPRTIKTNRIRGRTQVRPTLQAIVTENHTPGLSLYVLSVIAIMKQDLSEPLKELSDKGFIRPVPCTGELGDDPLSAPRIETYLISSKGRVSTRRSTFKVRTERHEKHRRIVLELLKKEELYAKSSAECLDSQRGDKQEVDFKLLKKKLCSAPILALPEGSEDFIDTATTSKKGFGACVDAERKLISYASRQFLRFMRKTTTTHD